MLHYIFDYYSNPYRMYLKYEFDIVKTQNLQTVLLIETVRLIGTMSVLEIDQVV